MSSTPITDLPIENVVPELRSYLKSAGRAVLVAEPGAGKSTIVPLRLLDEPWLGEQRILVLEPRRVAARAVARRMAQLLGSRVGDVVGYRTRDDSKVGPATRIEVVTEGILTRRLQSDPELSGIGAVLFDEFHERSIHADMGLAFTLDVMETIRPDLRLVVMSATIDAQRVARLLGGDSPAPVVDCPGRSFPVDIKWRPRKRRQRLEDAVVSAVNAAQGLPGDILVFLPGVAEIRRVVGQLDGLDAGLKVLPLYGGLDSSAQDQALTFDPHQRRVIVSTDVAETSLTVEGVGVVIDGGVTRRPRYDASTGLTKLTTIDHSRSSADQRAGRAGRLGPGVAIRLWSKAEHGARRRHDRAEILNVDVASIILEAAAWGTSSLDQLRLLDIPPKKTIETAVAELSMLGAIDAAGQITDTGRSLLALPLPPRAAAMVALSGDGPLGWTASVLAALLTERDVLGGRPADRPCDMWTRVELVQDKNKHVPGADVRAIQTVRSRASDIAGRIKASRTSIGPADIGRTLALGYPDRIAQNRGGKGGRFRLRTGMGAQVPQTDTLAVEPMIVVAELSGEKRNPQIRKAAGIDAIDVELGFHSEITERRFFGWDDQRNDVQHRVERRLGSLDFGTVDEKIEASPKVTEVLIAQIQKTGLGLLEWSDRARALQARVQFARHHCPEEDLADLSDERLLADAAAVFEPWLTTATSRSDVANVNLAQVLEAELGWAAKQRVDELAPTSFRLPSGREVPIGYTASGPVVSVRVQELFGVVENPCLLYTSPSPRDKRQSRMPSSA